MQRRSAAWVHEQNMARAHRLNFDWQIGLWWLSAIIGAGLAFNSSLALVQFMLVTLGVILYVLFYNAAAHRMVRVTLALLPAVVAIIFVLTNDWARSLGKLPALDPILTALAGWTSAVSPIAINPNVAGGVIAAFVPLQVSALRPASRVAQIGLLAISGVGLLLSASRGAWLALALAGGCGLLWRVVQGRIAQPRIARGVWLTALVIGGVAAIALLTQTPIGDRVLGLGGDRPLIWRNSVDLLGDYAFTGLGFGSFEMAYSSYALLIHVGHTTHAHNLWLDIWLVQGALGVVALAGLGLNAIWPTAAPSPWRWPALMSIAVLLIHGLYDDAIYGYGGAALPLILIPIALAAPDRLTPRSYLRRPALAVWAVALGAIIISAIWPQGRALWQANLGALSQTRAELAVYHWPEVAVQDALRRSGAVDLTPAINDYRAALDLDKTSVVANRRLGQIELAQGDYASACERLHTAFDFNPNQRATRQLLGECLALADQAQLAAAVWQPLDVGQGQLLLRRFWYIEYLHDQARGDKVVAAIELLP